MISKYDVDGDTMFSASEIRAIQDAEEMNEEPTETLVLPIRLTLNTHIVLIFKNIAIYIYIYSLI